MRTTLPHAARIMVDSMASVEVRRPPRIASIISRPNGGPSYLGSTAPTSNRVHSLVSRRPFQFAQADRNLQVDVDLFAHIFGDVLGELLVAERASTGVVSMIGLAAAPSMPACHGHFLLLPTDCLRRDRESLSYLHRSSRCCRRHSARSIRTCLPATGSRPPSQSSSSHLRSAFKWALGPAYTLVHRSC